MKIQYVSKRFNRSSKIVIQKANDIIEAFEVQGYQLNLRQIYYQFVARNVFPQEWFDEKLNTFNTQKNYKKLGSILSDARLAGLVSWEAIEDKTRFIRANQHWESPGQILEAAAEGYYKDRWEDQEYHLEFWIEKDALIGILETVCRKHDVAHFSCRGYVSQSEMWRAAQRLKAAGAECIIFHLGDHDPSGIDMTRDIQDRLNIFGASVDVQRIALNMDQVKKYDPPPNPAKTTDSRYQSYISEYGQESWELDALEPKVIEQLVEKHIEKYVDHDMVADVEELEEKGQRKLRSFIKKLNK